MTTMMLITRRVVTVCFLSCLFTVALATRTEAQQLGLSAINATVVIQPDGTVQATFTIQVTNREQAAMTNFTVTYTDGTTAFLPDIPSQGSAVSDPQSRTIDISHNGSASIPVPVTLTYNLDGTPVEVSKSIALRKP